MTTVINEMCGPEDPWKDEHTTEKFLAQSDTDKLLQAIRESSYTPKNPKTREH